MYFHGLKVMDLVEQVHIFGLTNIHTFEPNINLIRLFSLKLNYAKPRMLQESNVMKHQDRQIYNCTPGYFVV